METKVCSKCNIKKDVTEFYFRKNRKGVSVLSGQCKECRKSYKYNWDRKNKNKHSIYHKTYYEKNKVSIRIKSKKYKEVHKEEYLSYLVNYRKNNRESLNSYMRNYRKTNPLDDLSKLKKVISGMIRKPLNKNGYTKKSNTYTILGCSYEEFKLYIESQFEDWMSWDNYGLYNGEENYGWDLDHIVPLSSAQCEEDVYKLNHHSNIQPLCSYINRNVKRDNIDWKS